MAFITLIDGTARTVPPERAVRLREIMLGKSHGNRHDRRLAGQIKKIYFAERAERDIVYQQTVRGDYWWTRM